MHPVGSPQKTAALHPVGSPLTAKQPWKRPRSDRGTALLASKLSSRGRPPGPPREAPGMSLTKQGVEEAKWESMRQKAEEKMRRGVEGRAGRRQGQRMRRRVPQTSVTRTRIPPARRRRDAKGDVLVARTGKKGEKKKTQEGGKRAADRGRRGWWSTAASCERSTQRPVEKRESQFLFFVGFVCWLVSCNANSL